MARGKHGVFAPDSSGTRIPETVKSRAGQRPRRYAEERLAGRYTRLDVRFRGQFCHVDACTEPEARPDWPETREEYLERLRNTPTRLCRPRNFGHEERWGFAFYAYSSERYQLAVFGSGEFLGPPKEALHRSAEAYL